MSFSVPLASYAGRAGHGLEVAVRYSSKVTRLDYRNVDDTPVTGLKTWTVAEFAEHTAAGWTSTLGAPRVEFTGMGQYFDADGRGGCDVCTQGAPPAPFYVKRIHVHMPDGSSHELRLDDQVYFFPLDPFTGTFRAVDGSRLRFESNAGAPSVLRLPDGSHYVFPAYNDGYDLTATQYVDRHGNTLSYDAAARQWTDTLGRVLADPLPATPAANTETYFRMKRVGGAGESVFTFRWKSLGDVLTPDPQTGLPPPLHYPGNLKCSPNSYPGVSGPSLYTSSFDTKVCVERDANDQPLLFNPAVLSEVELPTGQKYHFTYNVYGEIDRIHLPTGGRESFVYGEAPSLSRLSPPYDEANRGVVERRVSARGDGSDDAVWAYGTSPADPNALRVTAPDQTYTELLVLRSGYTGVGENHMRHGFDDVRIGMAYEERLFYASGQMLRRTLRRWAADGPTPANASTASRDPRVEKEVSLLLDTGGDALAATTRYQHDRDRNVVSTEWRAYTAVHQQTAQTAGVDAMPQGDAVLRTDEATYLVNDLSLSQETRDAYRARNMTGLVSSMRVKDGAGAVVAKSSVHYDEPAYPLLYCGAAVGWADPAAVRGNPTTTKSWLGIPDAWVETHAQTDHCGNVRKTWNAHGSSAGTHGRVSEAKYDDGFSDGVNRDTFAYPTRTISADPDAAGPMTPLETATAYDFSTGRVTSTTDPNGQTTSLFYTDPLNRLKRVLRPAGAGETLYEYKLASGSPSGTFYVETFTSLDASRSTYAFQFFDGLGRPSRSFQHFDGAIASGGDKYLTTDTRYDSMGRVAAVSDPYTSSGSTSGVPADARWIETTYDAVGRVTQVETKADGAKVVTAYTGHFMTSGGWGPAYTTSLQYNLAGGVTRQTYPSGRAVSYTYDAAGRPSAFGGDLGGGAARDYVAETRYDGAGRRQEERYGTQTPVYNKSFYNSRGQLAEIRVSTHSVAEAAKATDYNRGAIINHYANALGAWGAHGGGPDNNGNLRRQSIYIPKDDSITDYWLTVQHYAYDQLNRLDRASEERGGQTTWQQDYEYDRWGNRTINPFNTTGGVSATQFSVDQNTNRLGVPAGSAAQMAYDPAGNLTTDTYTGQGTRTFDVENRMVSAQYFDGQVRAATYAYDAGGRRVTRDNGLGAVVHQVYGAGGELLAEYAPSAPPSSPRKEYGYRSGELLVVAEPGGAAPAPSGQDSVWFEDSTPSGATLYGNGEGWSWVGSNPTPYAGTSAHQRRLLPSTTTTTSPAPPRRSPWALATACTLTSISTRTTRPRR